MIIAFVLLFLLINLLICNRKEYPGLILAFTLCIYVSFIYSSAVFLSLINKLHDINIKRIWWILIFALLLFSTLILIKKHFNPYKYILKLINELYKCKKCKIYTIIFISCYFFISIYFACSTVPYNGDSMEYHLPRLIFWLKNGTIAHFAVADGRMLQAPVLKELVDLNIYSLYCSENDCFLNLTQTISYFISCYYIWLISRIIGCTKKISIFALCLFMTTPAVLVEAFSTQVDLFASMWGFIFIYFILFVGLDHKRLDFKFENIIIMFCLALSVSYVYLSKPSGFILIFTVLLWVIIVCIRHKVDLKILLSWIFCSSVIVIATILPDFFRHFRSSGNIIPTWYKTNFLVSTIDLRYPFMNFIKNLFFNLTSNLWTWMDSIFLNSVKRIAAKFRIDEFNRLISIRGQAFDVSNHKYYTYDINSNYGIIFISLLCIIMIFVGRVRKCIKLKNTTTDEKIINSNLKKINDLNLFFLLVCIGVFLAFSFIKWDIAVNRYFITYFGILAPVTAYGLQNLKKIEVTFINNNIREIIIGMALLICFSDFGANMMARRNDCLQYRTFSEHNEAYYWNYNGFETQFIPLRNFFYGINANVIGIDSRGLLCKYPLLRLISSHCNKLKFCNVINDSKIHEDSSVIPEYIVIICNYTDKLPNIFEYEYGGVKFKKVEKLSDCCYLAVR